MKDDKFFLRKAIEIAARGIKAGGGPFGAVIIRKGEVISEAYNMVVLTHDPTAHAEILAIRKAAGILQTHSLKDCTIYTSCEPCPMCLGAIYWAGIARIVYASDRVDAAAAGFSDKHIYNELSLDPSDREIEFMKIDDKEGNDVFGEWVKSENKIPY